MKGGFWGCSGKRKKPWSMGKRRSKSILQLLYRTLNQNDLYSQKAISLTMLWLAHNSFDKKEPKKNFFTELCNYFSPLMPQTSTQVSNKRMTVDFKIVFGARIRLPILRICDTNRKCIPYIIHIQFSFFQYWFLLKKSGSLVLCNGADIIKESQKHWPSIILHLFHCWS